MQGVIELTLMLVAYKSEVMSTVGSSSSKPPSKIFAIIEMRFYTVVFAVASVVAFVAATPVA